MPRPAALLRQLHLPDLPAAVLIGLLGAAAVSGFHLALNALEHLLTGMSGSLVGIARQLPAWQRAALPAAGGLLAGLVLQHGLRLARGSAGGDYLEAVRVGDGRLGLRTVLIKCLSSLFTVASGGSIGREGAMVSLAALGGSLLARRQRLSLPRRRLLVACGIAAGWSAAYHAPLAGVLFVCQVVRPRRRWRGLPPLIVASAVASLASGAWFKLPAIYHVPPLPALTTTALLAYCLVACALGLLAPWFLQAMNAARRAFAAIGLTLPARMALGGLIVGSLAWFWPEMWGNGYSTVSALLTAAPLWQTLLALLLCKLLATAATSGSGAVGGIFTPMLFVGAAGGALIGLSLNALWPGAAPLAGVIVTGMAAFLAATAQAPWLAVVMMLEMTASFGLTAPLLLASWLAARLSRRLLGGRALYDGR